jgi:hypothetical protein
MASPHNQIADYVITRAAAVVCAVIFVGITVYVFVFTAL